MNYLPGGYLKSLEMYDNNGILDKYVYGYDSHGNRTEIERLRRDLNDISGKYTYEYDIENRLTDVSLNGNPLRSYSYDAYGNRSTMLENGQITKYTYDELDRLTETVAPDKITSYGYDRRGNQTTVRINNQIQKEFTFDAANLLNHVRDVEKGEADYSYNGVGKRVAVTRPEEKIEYLLDLTKDYHNMLERSVNGEVEAYIYDNNVVSMTKAGNNYFYMLDELGTGMYLTGTDGIATSTYAYDEFGRNLNPFTGKREKPSYTKHGNLIQPLVFTGYQNDEMTDSYFAQARYYNSDAGRFVSEDKVRGFIDKPDTINHYLYCRNDPVDMEDLDGNIAILVTIAAGAFIGGVAGGVGDFTGQMISGMCSGKTISEAFDDIQWKEVALEAGKGAVVGGVAGSGAGLFAVSATAGGVETIGDLVDQKFIQKKDNVDVSYAISKGALTAGTTLLYGGITNIISGAIYPKAKVGTMEYLLGRDKAREVVQKQLDGAIARGSVSAQRKARMKLECIAAQKMKGIFIYGAVELRNAFVNAFKDNLYRNELNEEATEAIDSNINCLVE
jgi:RHS repeat-associated protein